jgi:hypothetical protein
MSRNDLEPTPSRVANWTLRSGLTGVRHSSVAGARKGCWGAASEELKPLGAPSRLRPALPSGDHLVVRSLDNRSSKASVAAPTDASPLGLRRVVAAQPLLLAALGAVADRFGKTLVAAARDAALLRLSWMVVA